eukprot:CAMPEP_0185017450 /NCGR_PEP_ID=MMETSP1103-20130426/402_1 /TAXON_ID=36769 /ORGANISM="Paraphysomonas bandaiensis, Strain Caron Lab Isolate" /LENGTH=737 /DNA_ID=CAMNT_0027546869 /DNA_START=74 /DNA_END=2287 /DNA_ORIENTATION=-
MNIRDYGMTNPGGYSHTNQAPVFDTEDKLSHGFGNFSQGGPGAPYDYLDNPALRRVRDSPPSMQRNFSDSQIHIGRKAPALGGSPPQPSSPIKRNESTFVMDISPSVVGWIIGRSGIRIKEIQAQTGCKMWVDQDVPNDQPRKIYFHGTKQNIDSAVNRVSELVQTAPILASASVTSGKSLTSTIVDCPVSLVGLLIGKRGWTIKKIQQASGAQISINQSVREGLPRKIIVSGDESAVATALHLIDEVLRDKSLGTENDPRDPLISGHYAQHNGHIPPQMDYAGSRPGRTDSPVYGAHGSGGPLNVMYRQHAQSHSSSPPSHTMHGGAVSGRYSSPLRSQENYGEYSTSARRVPSILQSQYEQHQQQGPDRGLSSSPYGQQQSQGYDRTFPQGYEPRPQGSGQGQQQRHYEDIQGVPVMVNRDAEGEERWSGVREGSPTLSVETRDSRSSEPSLLSYHLRQQHQRSVQQQGPPIGYSQRPQDAVSAYRTSSSSSLEMGLGSSPIEHRGSDPLGYPFDMPRQQPQQHASHCLASSPLSADPMKVVSMQHKTTGIPFTAGQSSSPSQLQLSSSPASVDGSRLYGGNGTGGAGLDSSNSVFVPSQQQHSPHMHSPFLRDTYGVDHHQQTQSLLRDGIPAGISPALTSQSDYPHSSAPDHNDMGMCDYHFSGAEHGMFDGQFDSNFHDLSIQDKNTVAGLDLGISALQTSESHDPSSSVECDQSQQPNFLPPAPPSTENVE